MSYPIVAYSLWQSLEHLDSLPEDPMDRKYGEAENYDALIYKPTEPKEIPWNGTTGTIPYPGPEPINLVGFLDRLPYQTDLLSTDDIDLEPVISKRMLYVLRSVGEFPYKAISTRIYDYRFQDQGDESYGRHDYEGPAIEPGGEFNEDYVGLQLLEHIDVIDYEHSEFRPRINPDRIPHITNLVLKEPVNGFPPIFRLNRADKRSTLYVSPAAKVALEEAGIKGLGFTEYEGTRAEEMSVSN
jgi:hypothetical protein